MQEDIFDISDIPVFAYEPSAWAWLFLLGIVALALIFSIWLKQRRAKFKLRIYDIAQIELKEIANSSRLDSRQLSRFSLIVRRLLGAILHKQVSSFSYQELSQLQAELTQQSQKEIISALLRLENYKYSAEEIPTQEFLQALNTTAKHIESLKLDELARK